MSIAGAIRAGRAFIELTLEDKKVKKGFEQVQARAKKIQSGLNASAKVAGAFGASITGAMSAAFVKTAQYADILGDLRTRTGIAAESLQKLDVVARRNGTTLQQVTDAIFRMNRRLANAQTETGPAARAVKEMGLNLRELMAMNAEERFLAIADSLAKMDDQARASQMGFELLGDNWKQLQPLITQGADEIRKAMDMVDPSLSDEDVDSFKELTAVWENTKQEALAVAVEISKSLLPVVKEMIPIIRSLLKEWKAYAKENPEAAVNIAKLGALMLTLSGGLKAASLALGPVVKLTGALSKGFAGIAGGTMAAAVATLAAEIVILAKGLLDLGKAWGKLREERARAENLEQRRQELLEPDEDTQKELDQIRKRMENSIQRGTEKQIEMVNAEKELGDEVRMTNEELERRSALLKKQREEAQQAANDEAERAENARIQAEAFAEAGAGLASESAIDDAFGALAKQAKDEELTVGALPGVGLMMLPQAIADSMNEGIAKAEQAEKERQAEEMRGRMAFTGRALSGTFGLQTLRGGGGSPTDRKLSKIEDEAKKQTTHLKRIEKNTAKAGTWS